MSNHLEIHIPGDRGRLYEVIKYPAGELQVRLTDAGILAAVKAQSYTIEANPIPDVIELAQLAEALNSVHYFYKRIVYLPYLPFSRADRRFQTGDTFALKVFVKLL